MTVKTLEDVCEALGLNGPHTSQTEIRAGDKRSVMQNPADDYGNSRMLRFQVFDEKNNRMDFVDITQTDQGLIGFVSYEKINPEEKSRGSFRLKDPVAFMQTVLDEDEPVLDLVKKMGPAIALPAKTPQELCAQLVIPSPWNKGDLVAGDNRNVFKEEASYPDSEASYVNGRFVGYGLSKLYERIDRDGNKREEPEAYATFRLQVSGPTGDGFVTFEREKNGMKGYVDLAGETHQLRDPADFTRKLLDNDEPLGDLLTKYNAANSGYDPAANRAVASTTIPRNAAANKLSM